MNRTSQVRSKSKPILILKRRKEPSNSNKRKRSGSRRSKLRRMEMKMRVWNPKSRRKSSHSTVTYRSQRESANASHTMLNRLKESQMK